MRKVEDLLTSTTREERRAHLRLELPCDLRGGTSVAFRGLLAHALNTTIPVSKEVFLCHACNNGGCSNWQHLYWGTRKDNGRDYRESPGWISTWQKTVAKHGEDNARQLVSKAGKSKNSYGGGTPYSLERFVEMKNIIDSFTKTRGWKQKCSLQLGISHTQLNRFMKKYY